MSEHEERARLSGWTPQEEFKGDPDKWVEAEVWNEKADNIMPILRATNKTLEGKLTASENDLSSTKAEVKELRAALQGLQNVTKAVSEKAYNQAKKDLAAEQKKAAEDDNWQKFDELEAEKDKLEKPTIQVISDDEKPANTDTDTNTDANLKAWNDFVERNKEWWSVNPTLTGFASIKNRELEQDPGFLALSAEKQLMKMEKLVKEAYPEEFGNKRRNNQSVESNGEPAGSSAKPDDFSKLPKEAKDQYKRLKSDYESQFKKDYTKEEFLAAYNS